MVPGTRVVVAVTAMACFEYDMMMPMTAIDGNVAMWLVSRRFSRELYFVFLLREMNVSALMEMLSQQCFSCVPTEFPAIDQEKSTRGDHRV
jgi:hypothetical protein